MIGPVDRPFYRHLGIEVIEAVDGSALVRMPAQLHLGNARGDVHGGAIAALLDAALSSAARAASPPSTGVTTIQFSTHFLAPGRGNLMARARTVRNGRTIVTAEGVVTDEAGDLVAQALGSWRVLPPG